MQTIEAPPGRNRATVSRALPTEVMSRFVAERDAPRRARHTCVAALREWGYEETLVEDAALVLSELATNAVCHAGSPFWMVVSMADSRLRIAVRDMRPLATAASGGVFTPQTGHGLGLIDAVAARWGVERVPDGKVVWAELRA